MNFAPDARRRSTERLKPAPIFKHPVTFHYEIHNHTTRIERLTKAFRVYRLMASTLICVIAGLTIGMICRPYAENWTERQFMYIEMPGELYLRFLKLMIIPLLVSNVILSFGTIQGKISSHLGKVAFFLYLGSNFMAIIVAILLSLMINPGKQYISRDIENVTRLKPDYLDDPMNRYRDHHPKFLQAMNHDPSLLRVGRSIKDDYSDDYDTDPIEDYYNDDAYQTTVSNETLKTNNKTVGQNPANHIIFEINDIGLSTKLPIDVLLDVLRNVVPDSIISATMQQTRTKLVAPKQLIIEKNGTTNPPPHKWALDHEIINQPNIIGLLAMSVLTGVVLSHMEEASKPILDLCASVSELSLRIGMKAIHLASFCIMFLLIGQVARARDLSLIAGELLMYSITVTLGLMIHGLVLLPLVYYAITRKSPIALARGLMDALVAAFATSSSSATMALTLSSLAELDLNPMIARAFGPLGSIFNMNGTAMYMVVGVIFIAQTLQVTLPLTSLLLIGLSSAIASLSTAGIPSSGMMTMVIVLNAVNLPVLQLSLIYIVDFIIDRFRTVINVWSGAVVCGLIDHICPDNFFEEEMEPEKYREMMKYRGSRASLGSRKSSMPEEKPQVISVTITPPVET